MTEATAMPTEQNFLKSWYFGKRMFSFDILVAVLVTALSTWQATAHLCPISDLLERDGTALYGSFLSALAALLGFAIAAVAIIANLVATAPFKNLRRSEHYGEFWLAFKWSIRALALATFVSLVALFANKFDALRYATLITAVGCILTATASLVRSGYTLEEVLKRTKDVDKALTETQSQYDPVI